MIRNPSCSFFFRRKHRAKESSPLQKSRTVIALVSNLHTGGANDGGRLFHRFELTVSIRRDDAFFVTAPTQRSVNPILFEIFRDVVVLLNHFESFHHVVRQIGLSSAMVIDVLVDVNGNVLFDGVLLSLRCCSGGRRASGWRSHERRDRSLLRCSLLPGRRRCRMLRTLLPIIDSSSAGRRRRRRRSLLATR